ncbi:recombinase family protein [Actinopolymorpha pittospori]|uniref:Site-specific DNA recombinase n=1 Tax=Actinopolymorpha pittospori TaxID=648752 RepID=A0A927RK04_9ACTN|nr:recombinase family protein [Actinopolymorpha pittospori]MBE1606213.1 site-specific DNA recombinase [Actinopolymorpha pittospori]
MRALIYARLSRSKDNSTSIVRQLEACRQEAERRGWQVVGEYADDGVSGAVDPSERPEATKLLARLDEADVILVWKLDRLARSFLAFADLMRVSDRAAVGMTSVTEPLDTTSPMGRAMIQIIAVFAELERAMIRERSLASRAYLRTTERHISGRAPYGLRIVPAADGKGKALQRDPEAVEVIREILARLVDGEPGTTIAADLERRAVPTPRVRTSLKPNPKPSHWSYQAIKHMLGHPSLLGHKIDERGHVRRDEQGAELIFWEPVTDRATLEAARLAVEARSVDKTSPNRRHWLFGVALCAKCGRPLTQNARAGRSYVERGWDTRSVLRCLGTREEPCAGVLIAEHKLSEWVEEEVLRTVGRFEAIEPVYVPGSDVEADLAAVERAIGNLRDDRDAGLFDDDEDDYRERMSALVGRRKALRAAPSTEPRWQYRSMGCTVAELWKTLEPAGRGDLLRTMGVTVEVSSANRRRNVTTGERARVVLPDESGAWQAPLEQAF